MRAMLVLAVWAVSAAAVTAQVPGRAVPPAAVKRPSPPQATAPAPEAAPPVAEAVRSFDPTNVALAWNNRRWQLVHQGEVLKDFGTREQEARQALRLIQELKLDGHGTVGSPRPVMEYWLAAGQAPRARVSGGLRALALEPERLRVEQVGGLWYVNDGPRPLFCFGQSADDARQALGVLRKHHFDQVAVIGRAAPSMYVFLRRPHDEAPALPADTAPLAGAPAASDRRGQPHFGHRPLQPPAPPSDRVLFDWRQAQLRQVNGEWRLQAGSLTLARFGQNFREGQQALAALRHYRFTEQRRVGEPAVIVYAAHARSPRGVLLGLPAERFQPEQLAVQQVGNNYALVQGQRVVLSMGASKPDAEKMLEVVKKQGFDRLCKIGEPEKEGMTFFVRSR
jgi:hypothetical protein